MASQSNRPVRVAGASGSVSDRRFALASFARNYTSEPIDVIICDYMSEGTMCPAAVRKSNNDRNPGGSTAEATNLLEAVGPAFEPTFLEAIEPALFDLAKYKIRIACNAGASEPRKCYEALKKLIDSKSLEIPVAWIDGDDVLDTLKDYSRDNGCHFKNIYTEEDINDWTSEPLAAQAYLGGLGIAEAFKQGAQIVVCGRVSDASPIIGAAYWWHGWERHQFHELANALVAGHLLECSTYVTGGNYSGFKDLEHGEGGAWADLGYPIGEIAHDGSVIITKQKGTGGVVNVHTCSSQLLYEIQGPWYFNSDVTAVLPHIYFEQIGPDRVALRGVEALPPPPTTKVGCSAVGGYQVEMLWFLTGLDIAAKARMLETQVRRVLAPALQRYTLLKFHIIGAPVQDGNSQDAATCVFRIFAQAPLEEDLAPSKFLRPITDNIMQPYPGGTYHLDVRQGLPKPYYEYFVTLMSQIDVQHTIHFQGKETSISPPTQTKNFPSRQPSQTFSTMPVDLARDFGPSARMALGTIVFARSGDKGPDCNCGLWVRQQDEYEWLRSLLSVECIKTLLGKEYDTLRTPRIEIERFELPNLKGVHFLFRNLLDRGVTSTSGIDFLGKNVAEFLRQRHVDVPLKFVERGKL